MAQGKEGPEGRVVCILALLSNEVPLNCLLIHQFSSSIMSHSPQNKSTMIHVYGIGAVFWKDSPEGRSHSNEEAGLNSQ